ncbi:MAG: DUF3108 domain-containing protein [Nannocystaceae bacterium]
MNTRRSRGGTTRRPALADLAERPPRAAGRSLRRALAAAALLAFAVAAPSASAEPSPDASDASEDRLHLTPKKGPRAQSEAPATDAGPEANAKAKANEKPKSKASAKKTPAKAKPKHPGKREPQGLAPTVAAGDLSKLPRLGDPPVVPGYDDRFAGVTGVIGPALGWSGALADPDFVDRRRRYPLIPRPAPFGDSLRPGERFRYDVTFSGNPTGVAEAAVVAREPGPFGSPDRVRLEGFAKTGGVVSLLTTLTYTIKSVIDADTGASITTYAETQRTGLGRDRSREVNTTFGGRGYVEIHDKRIDDKTREVTLRKRIPVDTFDSLSVMAWVRALDLAPGERARVYGLDGKVLLRVDVEGKGKTKLDPMPGIGTALGLRSDDVYELSGSITRVDSYGAPLPGKKVYKMRVWVSDDGRRIPLVLESDVWLGVVRLILTQYDPPHSEAGGGADDRKTTPPAAKR